MRRSTARWGLAGLALGLFTVNNLAVIAASIAPPTGYVPSFLNRGGDFAVYKTWLTAFERDSRLPDYHAPWQTEPVFFNLLPFTISRVSRLLGMSPLLGYHLFHLLFYAVAIYSLDYAVRTFTQTRMQARAAWAVIVLSVPITSLLVAPVWTLSGGRWTPLPVWTGLNDFVFWSSDGLFHGISGSIFVTFGTATTILAFALLARYLQTGRPRFLLAACLTTNLSAFVHPYEVVVIGSAGSLTLLVLRWRRWARLAAEMGALGAAALLGVLPLALTAHQTPWVRAAAEVNRWMPPNPLRLLATLGVPSIFAVILLVARPRMSTKTDVLLQIWFVSTLVGLYVPGMPWSQHLLDGFLYGAAILLVRQLAHSRRLAGLRDTHPRMATAAFVGAMGLSLIPYIMVARQSFHDGRAADPKYLFSAVEPRDEQEVIAWLRRHAQPDQLILAPPAHAPWLATVPMHSFGSHFAYSLTYPRQRRLAEDFYSGRLPSSVASELLQDYGIRYVVVSAGSPASVYVHERQPSVEIGALLLYEFPDHVMKPYR